MSLRCFIVNNCPVSVTDLSLFVLYSQTLAIANTATSTFTTLLGMEGTSIPAFQTFFNYVLLNIIFTPYTIYRYGIKRWFRLMLKDGWKCTWIINRMQDLLAIGVLFHSMLLLSC